MITHRQIQYSTKNWIRRERLLKSWHFSTKNLTVEGLEFSQIFYKQLDCHIRS